MSVERGCTVLIGAEEVTFKQGERFDYHGSRIGIRVALFDGEKTSIIDSQDFVMRAQRDASNLDACLKEYVEACPKEPSLPLRYSPLQETLESHQIVVFRLTERSAMYRVHLSRRGRPLPENLSADPKLVSEMFRLFDDPTDHDLIYLQIRDLVDHTHVPNIGAGRFNGKIDGESILGRSDDAKIGKRMRLIQTPRVSSTMDQHRPSLAVFEPGDHPRNPLGSAYLMHHNMTTDRERWAEFLETHKVESNQQQADDLYLAINAGCMIGMPRHYLETIDKTDKATFWRPAHTGDKVVGIGPVDIQGETQQGILKGTRLDWPVHGVDFLVADAFKGIAPNPVDSHVVYTNPTEYMSNGFRYGQLPMTTGLYADRLGDLDTITEALEGRRIPELVAMMSYEKEVDGKLERRLPKSGDMLRLSELGFWTAGGWFSYGLDEMFMGYVRKHVTQHDLLIWKVLSPTIGKAVDEVFVPSEAFHRSRKRIARLLAPQVGAREDEMIQTVVDMTEWELMDWVNDQDFQSLLVTVPMVPGVHTKHKLRVWENDTVGIHPRLMLSLLRDADGDLACVVIPRV